MTGLIVTCRLPVASGSGPDQFHLSQTTVSLSPQSGLTEASTVTGRALLSRLALVLLIEDFAQALRHQVRPLCTAVVPLEILHWNQIRLTQH